MSSIHAGHDVFSIGSINARDVAFYSGDHSGSGSAGGSNQVKRDVFRPSFYTPPNPREVLLDFGLSVGDTTAHTPEAKALHEILSGGVNREETKIVSIYGKAGVGKSCILRGLGNGKVQEKLKKHFPDGIYFLSLGMDATEATIIHGLVEIIKLCGGEELAKDMKGEHNLHAVMNKVKEWMKGRKCLILVDDCWERNGLGAGKVRELADMVSGESGSVLVMATRFIDLARTGSVVKVEERETDSTEAEAILLRHAKFGREEIEDEEEIEAFCKVLKMCGGLPLFLAVAGRGVAELAIELECEECGRKVVWRKYWKELQAIGQNELFDTESDEYPDLSTTLQLSLELLSKRRGKRLAPILKSKSSFHEMHRALCVFKKQARIPVSVCRRLWNVRSDEGAFRIIKWFAGVGLADIESRRLGEKHVEYVRVHDLVHMFAVGCAEREEGVARWHGRLLEGYMPKAGDSEVVRKWWEVNKNDGGDEYLFENVCRHLVRSGNLKELEGLLVSGEWSKFRHEVGGMSAWNGDFWECLEGRRNYHVYYSHEMEIERGLEMVRDVVVESWAFVHENPAELGYQVTGRLMGCKNKIVRRYLRSIEEVQCKPWLKPLQRCWERPGVGMMVGEFHFDDIVRDIVLHQKSFTAVAGVGEEVAIIDLKEMKVKARYAGHTGWVVKVGISGDGKRAFSCSFGGTVRQWDIESGEEHKDAHVQLNDEEDGKANDITSAAFSLESSFVVTGSWSGRIKVWDLRSGQRVGSTMDVSDRVDCITMSPNGRIVAAGLWKGSVVLCDVRRTRPLCVQLISDMPGVTSIVFSGDGRFVASCARDGTIQLWDVDLHIAYKGELQLGSLFLRCKGVPCSVAFIEDSKEIFPDVGKNLLAVCTDNNSNGSMSVWDMADGAAIRSWKAHTLPVKCAAVTGDVGDRWLVSCGGDRRVRVWDLQAVPNKRDEGIYHEDRVSCIATGRSGSCFVSGSLDKTLRIWNGFSGRPLGRALYGHEDVVTSVAVSPDDRRVISASGDCTIRIWDVAAHAQVGGALRGHKGRINCVAYSSDGKFVLSGSDDQTVRVWNVIDYRESSRGVGEASTKRARVAEPGDDVGDWEALRLEMTLRHKVPPDGWRKEGWGVNCVAVSRDGQRVVSGLRNGEIWVWDMRSGRCIDRKHSNDANAIEQIEISAKDEVVTMGRFSEMARWRLDNEGGLTRIPQNEDTTGTAQAGSQEGPTSKKNNNVVCSDRTVQLSCTGQKIATLPDNVPFGVWKYKEFLWDRVLCVGQHDGRVLFFQVEY